MARKGNGEDADPPLGGNGEDDTIAPVPCPWCSGDNGLIFHPAACPRVKAIEYHANGRVRRVELKDT